MLKGKTLGKIFLERAKKNPHKNAVGWIENGSIQFLSYSDYRETIEEISCGLLSLGLLPGDKVSILSGTRKEWNLADLSILCSKGITIPVYPSYTAHEIAYIVNHSESVLIFIENEKFLKKIVEAQDDLQQLKFVVSFEPISEDAVKTLPERIKFYSLDELIRLGLKFKEQYPKMFEDNIDSQTTTDVASIIYTSGTTGEPKGAVITHYGFTSMMQNLWGEMKSNIYPNDRTLAFLPLSHVLGRCESLLPLMFGIETVYAESMDKVLDNLALAKPTILVAVPRIFEKLYAKVHEKIAKESLIKKSIFDWALQASTAYYQKIEKDEAPTSFEILQKNLAYQLVFEKIYNQFGGRIRFFISGGAPLSSDIIRFLQNANLTVLEGYGLTETIAPATLNPVTKQIPGTIGLPIGDVQIKFAEDGEIMIKSEAIFAGYYKNEEATRSCFTADGWFLTGDIGEITSEGYIRITDRKKDIIITSAGKNVAPQKIENMLKLKKHIAFAMVVGDKRKFLTAVICLDQDAFKELAQELALEGDLSHQDLSQNPKVKEVIQREVNEVNKELASYETIKGFIIAPNDFTVENGHITPSLKLKKKFILSKYESQMDALYHDLDGN